MKNLFEDFTNPTASECIEILSLCEFYAIPGERLKYSKENNLKIHSLFQDHL